MPAIRTENVLRLKCLATSNAAYFYLLHKPRINLDYVSDILLAAANSWPT